MFQDVTPVHKEWSKKKMEKEKQKWRRKSSFGLLVTKMAEVVVNAEEIKAGEKENEPCRGKSEK